nr:hypothetical protein CFP56_20507 [Quercus suber]
MLQTISRGCLPARLNVGAGLPRQDGRSSPRLKADLDDDLNLVNRWSRPLLENERWLQRPVGSVIAGGSTPAATSDTGERFRSENSDPEKSKAENSSPDGAGTGSFSIQDCKSESPKLTPVELIFCLPYCPNPLSRLCEPGTRRQYRGRADDFCAVEILL